jgi:hypothetical protein
MRLTILSLSLLALLACPTLADEILLKDGSKREGKIVKESPKEIVLEITQGSLKAQIILKRSEIKSITRGPTANDKLTAEISRRRNKLKSNDPRGWLALAQWIETHNGFRRESLLAYEKVIALDSDNGIARRKLGYHRVGKEWLTDDEIMLSKGFIQYRGRWMTKEQRIAAVEVEKQKQEALISVRALKESGRLTQAQEDEKAREQWLKDMQLMAEAKAARDRQAAYRSIQSESNGVVLGNYGYGTYGVRVGTQYIPYVPSNGPVYYYSPYYQPYRTYSRRSYYPSSYIRYTGKNWGIQLGGGGTSIYYQKK